MAESEIAQFREQQQLPAAVASHDAVIARIKQGTDGVAQLFQENRDDEAFALWESWHTS